MALWKYEVQEKTAVLVVILKQTKENICLNKQKKI